MVKKARVGLFFWILTCFFPTFSSGELIYTVEEERPVEAFVGDVFLDEGLANLRFGNQSPFLRFLKNHYHFYIDNVTGVIRTRQRIDREDSSLCGVVVDGRCEVKLDVVVQPLQFFRIIRVKVIVLDINDNSPYFMKYEDVLDIPEASPVGTKFPLPSAFDADGLEFSIKLYRLISESDAFRLEGGRRVEEHMLEPKLVVTRILDRELEDRHDVTLIALDGGEPPRSSSINLIISVSDVNDNPPEFVQGSYSVTITENIAINSIVIQVVAKDRDVGLNGQVDYSFSTSTESQFGHLFGVNETSGDIFVKAIIDYEKYVMFNLSVVAKDRGLNSMSAVVPVIVHVTDVNDNPPEITISTLSSSSGLAELTENSATGTFAAYVSVTDKDSGLNGKFTCDLDDASFTLTTTFDGEFHVLTNTVLDREMVAFYNLVLTCVDFGSDSQTSMSYISIHILDENDNDPVFSTSMYECVLIENNFVGYSILKVSATDADEKENSQISYFIEPMQASYLFAVNEDTGMITAIVSIDREKHGEQIKFWVVAKDHGVLPRSSSASVIVNVADVNDERPTFSQKSYSFAIPENYPEGSEVGTVAAQDLDSLLYGDVTYGMDSDVFEINPKTGRIMTLAQLDREEVSAYHVIVVAKDRGVPPLSSSASVTIYVSDENDNSPVFLYPVHPNNSVQVSTVTPKDHFISRIKAHDEDSGKNGKVHFYLRNRTDDNMFALEPELGTLSVIGDLSAKDGTTYVMELVAQDEGFPPRMAFSRIIVVVNKSVSFIWKSHTEQDIDVNMTLILIIAPVSAVVVTALIVAIAILCCQERQRTSSKYNCRLETLRLQQAQQEKNCCQNQLVKVKGDFGRQRNFVMEDALNECLPPWSAPAYPPKGSNILYSSTSPNTYSTCPFKSSSKQQVLCKSPVVSSKRAGRQHCGDGESIKSGYASNTDSGHGPSEEEPSQGYSKQKNLQTKQPHSNGNHFGNCHATNGCESIHSYSTQPNQMSTFQGTPRKNYTPDLIMDNAPLCDNSAYSQACYNSFKHHDSPYKHLLDLQLPQTACLSSESQRKLLDVEEELSHRTGSTEMNCNFLRNDETICNSPAISRRKDKSNGDINADELCNEIDQLFFKDQQPSKWKKMDN